MAYTFKPYEENEATKQARAQMQALTAQKPQNYQSQYSGQMQEAMSQMLIRQPFQYSLNGDAFYKQYADQAKRNGLAGMKNAMAQAAALTGGYGNSYAQTVGQQTYNAEMEKLNDRIPELYSMAMQAYQMQGQDMKDRYALMADADNRDYGRWQDQYANWQNDRNFAASRYDTERDLDYNRYTNERNFAYQQQKDQQTRDDYYRDLAQSMVMDYIKAGEEPPEWLVNTSQFDTTWLNWQREKAAAAASGRGGGSGSGGTSGDGNGSGAPFNIYDGLADFLKSGGGNAPTDRDNTVNMMAQVMYQNGTPAETVTEWVNKQASSKAVAENILKNAIR